MQLLNQTGRTPARGLGRDTAWQEPALQPQSLVTQLGSEVASTLSSALERVSSLAATGQIDRDGLRALREEIDRARRAGIMGQQLMRLSGNRMRLAEERVDLAGLLGEAVTLRQRASKAHDIRIKQTYTPLALASDAALMFSLVETMLDWAFEHAHSRLVLRLDAKLNPTRGRLTCAFLRRPVEAENSRWGVDPDSGEDEALNTLAWRLMQQTAAVLGLSLTRRDTADRSEMRLSLPGAEALPPPPEDTAGNAFGATHSLAGLETADVGALVWQDQPLAGRHVLVVANNRELRHRVRDALRPTGALLDFVSNVEEARELLADALPHAVIYEAAWGGERLQRLRRSLLKEAPTLAFIQLAEGPQAFEVMEADGQPYASVGQDNLHESLPAALLFELARGG